MTRAVVFDVGETLVDETRLWGEWADWLGVPRLTMFGVLGAVIQRGEDHRRVFEILRPAMDLAAETKSRRAAGEGWLLRPSDLYPDAIPCLRALRDEGLRLGIAGNIHDRETADSLAALRLPVDWVASSASWGVEKPDPDFFARMAEGVGCEVSEIAYVGDRIDNDVVPAADAGMTAVFIRRGPWALVQASRPEAARAAFVIDSLDELPPLLGRI